jgi:hypothetical protein
MIAAAPPQMAAIMTSSIPAPPSGVSLSML